MSNRERVRRLKDIRHTACGIGTRALKLRVNKLMKRPLGTLTKDHSARRISRAVKCYGGGEKLVAPER